MTVKALQDIVFAAYKKHLKAGDEYCRRRAGMFVRRVIVAMADSYTKLTYNAIAKVAHTLSHDEMGVESEILAVIGL